MSTTFFSRLFQQVVCTDFRAMVHSFTKWAVFGQWYVENVRVNTIEKTTRDLTKR